ncbi:MAG: endonuclease MutS2 [Ruminococcaceae bacterium]|nr:endonuclease MutS2 [Oscillospiraceae bacterium]
MNITEKTITTLEFDKIRRMLADACPTAGSAAQALTLAPAEYVDQVRRRQKRTTDARRLSDAKGMPSFGGVTDVGDSCERAQKGAILTQRELMDVAVVLRTSRSLLEYIRSNRLFETVLDEVFERLMPNRHLEDRIGRSILSEELIADEASPALAEVRRKIRAANGRVRETLSRYIGGGYSKFLQENIVTQRNGRYVIPVKAECRNEIKGLIHDTSSSGATIFVEPMAVVDANNELRMLEAKEAHEIERILAELSAQVADMADRLSLNYRNITELAFVFGCAELSRRMDAIEPQVTEERVCRLVRARHPLIDKRTVVPISLTLGGEYDTLIITGPNTGGKTVTLKTLGLFALMTQAGLHLPAEEGTSLCLFEKILVNLGDEQSIEQSLSTFSAHMVNIVSIVAERNDRSLVLFDELGAGTDPVEGAALAVAIIEDIRGAGALCASTTHYTELKTYALDTPGVCNASCEFDVETLRPTYRLIVGTPGKSNAFAISEKLGLPRRIIERANSAIGAENKRLEHVLGELEATRQQAEKQLSEATAMRSEYEAYRKDAEREIAERLASAERELENARRKAQNMVESAKASGDYIMEEMDKLRKQRESERLGEELARARREIREHLRTHSDSFDPVVVRRDEKYVLPRKLCRGDEVLIVSLGKKAVLLEEPDRSGKVTVQAGIIKTKVEVSDLQLIEEEMQIGAGEQKKKASEYRMSVCREFKDEIHLRGMTGDEAWSRVDKYFDEAQLAGFHTVRLVHGKGTGALKNALWRYLKTDRRVASFRIGQFGEGDGGVTVVELK